MFDAVSLRSTLNWIFTRVKMGTTVNIVNCRGILIEIFNFAQQLLPQILVPIFTDSCRKLFNAVNLIMTTFYL